MVAASFHSRQTFVRGGLLLLVSDSPQRALILHSKAGNNSTLKPCPDCWVTQTGPDGGELGNPFSEARLSRRKRSDVEGLFEELGRLPPGSSEAVRKSTELGVNPLNRDMASPMFEVMTIGEPSRAATADILHVDGQVRNDIDGRLYCKILKSSTKY